jgi:hypothetical protein
MLQQRPGRRPNLRPNITEFTCTFASRPSAYVPTLALPKLKSIILLTRHSCPSATLPRSPGGVSTTMRSAVSPKTLRSHSADPQAILSPIFLPSLSANCLVSAPSAFALFYKRSEMSTRNPPMPSAPARKPRRYGGPHGLPNRSGGASRKRPRNRAEFRCGSMDKWRGRPSISGNRLGIFAACHSSCNWVTGPEMASDAFSSIFPDRDDTIRLHLDSTDIDAQFGRDQSETQRVSTQHQIP